MTNIDAADQINTIIFNAFPQDTDGEYTPDKVLLVFNEIEKIGIDALDGVTQNLYTNGRVSKLLVKVGKPAAKYLEYAFEKGNQYQKNDAMYLLAEISSFEKLEVALLDSKNSEQSSVAKTLGNHLQVEILEKALRKEDQRIRRAAIQGLESCCWVLDLRKLHHDDPSYEKVVQLSISVLNDADPDLRWYALGILSRLKKLTLDILSKAVHDTDIRVRKSATGGLFSLGIDELTAPLLAEIVEDTDAETSEKAVEAISERNNKDKINPKILGNAIIDVLILRNTGLSDKNFTPEKIAQALEKTISLSPPLREQILNRLADLSYQHEDSVRTRSIRVAKKMEGSDFSTLIQGRSSENPSAAKAILTLLGEHSSADRIIDQLSNAAANDVQKISSLQTKLLQGYYENALDQAKQSFKWAVASNIFGLVCLIGVIAYLLISTQSFSKVPDLVGVLTGISTILSQFIAATQFWIYNRTAKRLEQSQSQLYQVQRFQLANTVCESIDGELREKTRAELVKSIANVEITATNK